MNLDIGFNNEASLARKRRKEIISQKKGSTAESSKRPRITSQRRQVSRTKTNSSIPGMFKKCCLSSYKLLRDKFKNYLHFAFQVPQEEEKSLPVVMQIIS